MPHIERPEPPYMQVVHHLRERILSGELAEGAHVPSARETAQDWGLSLATATKALATLRAEGLVRGVPGVGTIVTAAATAQPSARDRLRSIQRTGRIYPPTQHARIKSAAVVEAPDPVADALGVQAGALVIRRLRITYHDDQPVSSSTSWFHADLAKTSPMLLETARLTQGTSGYIEQTTGRKPLTGRDQLSASAASDEEAHDLGVEVGSAVLRERNWVYDDSGDVMEYGESTAARDRWTSYSYEIGAGS